NETENWRKSLLPRTVIKCFGVPEGKSDWSKVAVSTPFSSRSQSGMKPENVGELIPVLIDGSRSQ
ncbi:hypothetical protein BaRGS_00011969, partial [Batillaria attramentaria]